MLALGIDIGGSGIKGAVVDTRSGAIVSGRIRVPTPQRVEPKELVAILTATVGHHQASNHKS